MSGYDDRNNADVERANAEFDAWRAWPMEQEAEYCPHLETRTWSGTQRGGDFDIRWCLACGREVS